MCCCDLCRLLRLAGIRRRSQGDPFRFIDFFSDLRQEFSFSARRIIVAAFYIAVVVHWFACTLWWTIRLQNYPAGWPLYLSQIAKPERQPLVIVYDMVIVCALWPLSTLMLWCTGLYSLVVDHQAANIPCRLASAAECQLLMHGSA